MFLGSCRGFPAVFRVTVIPRRRRRLKIQRRGQTLPRHIARTTYPQLKAQGVITSYQVSPIDLAHASYTELPGKKRGVPKNVTEASRSQTSALPQPKERDAHDLLQELELKTSCLYPKKHPHQVRTRRPQAQPNAKGKHGIFAFTPQIIHFSKLKTFASFHSVNRQNHTLRLSPSPAAPLHVEKQEPFHNTPNGRHVARRLGWKPKHSPRKRKSGAPT